MVGQLLRFIGTLGVPLVAVTGAAVLAALALLCGGRRYRVAARRLVCPIHGREATVRFLVDAGDGEVYREVVDCSLRPPGETLGCESVCRSLSVAPFAVRQAANDR
jgi:hypothetical protein